MAGRNRPDCSLTVAADSTPWSEVENIVFNQIVLLHMLRIGKNSYADLHLLGSRPTAAAGVSIFTGEYLL
ncbi:hypothetical protein ACFXG4_40090 [Nocardia sp. NPDC059246]|uniref:hypothetical protein n=1 Tax=unclassified Nocardia TaxID=2637762 RepID=UPI003676E6CA